MTKEFPVIIKIFFFLLMAYTLTMGENSYADSTTKNDKAYLLTNKKLLRYIDTNEEYGKSCESYSYIPSVQRLKLLNQDTFMLGDILSDSLSIQSINPDHLVETNLTDCNNEGIDVINYRYDEKISYLNDNMVTIEVYQYIYGAGAAHGNGHTSHYIYDRIYGMKLDWKSLFGKSEAFDKYILKRVVSEIADDDFITYFKASNQLLNFRILGYFAINDKGLLIQYGKYEITPGASGLPSIMVPKEVLKQYMTKESYEKCFGTQDQMIMEARNDH